MRAARLLFVVIGVLVAQSAFAVEPDEILPDPNLEARARVISGELRCLVCQNQSIDDSAAPLARDLRLLVRERLKQGDSDSQVMDYLVQRFGEFILLRPRFEWQTLLLWIAPFSTLALGVVGAFVAMRRRRADSGAEEEQRLTDAELAELKQLE
ncbi:MAG TPA: cytochrome c-type biogenesis protein [Beijerinckiaceae bacterium]|nr:cytochrome c-type biogenesis protein [Beijerinckiaceae bacterium]